MHFDSLRPRLEKLGVILPTTKEHQLLRVLDKSARLCIDIQPFEPSDEEQILKHVESLLAKSLATSQQPRIRTSIQVSDTALEKEGVVESIAVLSELLGTAARSRVTLHGARVISGNITEKLKKLRQSLRRPKETEIRIVSPEFDFDDSQMEQLFQLGVRLRLASGWTRIERRSKIPQVDLVTFRKLSEFGFRAAIDWYVHDGSLDAFH